MGEKRDRRFELKDAKREQVPVLVGLSGPSGGGKTYSALRLAKGIQRIGGGDIAVIDTEARRALHYADTFRFKHLEFGEPFGSLDYLAALRYCHEQGAKIIIVDSLSHEHEGVGGLLDLHESELDRMAGNDWQKRERVKMLAWQKPKKARRAFINGMLQIPGNFIFCFRAKNSVRPVKVAGKTEIVPQGFMPIAGEEFVFEMTVTCLLPPAAAGVPQWESDYAGERMMMKLPVQFTELFAEKKPLDEQIGQALAEWASGGVSPSASSRKEDSNAESQREPAPSAIDQTRGERFVGEGDPISTVHQAALKQEARGRAKALGLKEPDAWASILQAALGVRVESVTIDRREAALEAIRTYEIDGG